MGRAIWCVATHTKDETLEQVDYDVEKRDQDSQCANIHKRSITHPNLSSCPRSPYTERTMTAQGRLRCCVFPGRTVEACCISRRLFILACRTRSTGRAVSGETCIANAGGAAGGGVRMLPASIAMTGRRRR
jgi:hypothetical protein